jgi:hypothetical protein
VYTNGVLLILDVIVEKVLQHCCLVADCVLSNHGREIPFKARNAGLRRNKRPGPLCQLRKKILFRFVKDFVRNSQKNVRGLQWCSPVKSCDRDSCELR